MGCGFGGSWRRCHWAAPRASGFLDSQGRAAPGGRAHTARPVQKFEGAAQQPPKPARRGLPLPQPALAAVRVVLQQTAAPPQPPGAQHLPQLRQIAPPHLPLAGARRGGHAVSPEGHPAAGACRCVLRALDWLRCRLLRRPGNQLAGCRREEAEGEHATGGGGGPHLLLPAPRSAAWPAEPTPATVPPQPQPGPAQPPWLMLCLSWCSRPL